MYGCYAIMIIFGDKIPVWIEGIIINIVAAILIGATVWFVRKRKVPKELVSKNFEIFNKKGKDLAPEDILGIRADVNAGFKRNFYFEREYDRIVMDNIRQGRNVLITGESLSGKTRLAYSVLTTAIRLLRLMGRR